MVSGGKMAAVSPNGEKLLRTMPQTLLREVVFVHTLFMLNDPAFLGLGGRWQIDAKHPILRIVPWPLTFSLSSRASGSCRVMKEQNRIQNITVMGVFHNYTDNYEEYTLLMPDSC